VIDSMVASCVASQLKPKFVMAKVNNYRYFQCFRAAST
jgi:hypothetical protein